MLVSTHTCRTVYAKPPWNRNYMYTTLTNNQSNSTGRVSLVWLTIDTICQFRVIWMKEEQFVKLWRGFTRLKSSTPKVHIITIVIVVIVTTVIWKFSCRLPRICLNLLNCSNLTVFVTSGICIVLWLLGKERESCTLHRRRQMEM